MLNKPYYIFPLIFSVFLTACDNTAKTSVSENTASQSKNENPPITIGYSDYPGWVAWQIAIDKGWLKDAGVNAEFKWFDYSASLNAFAAKQIDAVTIAHGDNLVISAGGTKGLVILATDEGAGNDLIVAKSGINSISDLKGKTVAVEKGLVDHLLLDTALTDANIKTQEVKIVNAVTNELPQVFMSPDISAVALWQPIANQALKNVPGSKIIYTASEKPGLIYGAMTVNAEHLMRHKEDWVKILEVWDRVVKYIKDPATHEDAVRIMASRAGIQSEQYKQFIDGTHFLSIQDNKTLFTKGTGLNSIYGSSYRVNEFNIKYGVYNTKLDVDSLISPEIVDSIK
ncbi:ABC transporter substrate-binding protein [Acinetobacter puyangensis]|uniref:NitT/TauT family transport system substrate-binding protein n=1 Tax=Acinetobacter puyangensis TaxID=1096779 RepID=A0A240E5T3_9GAMM|nr:ABC transporter substrate-binding protein [Acinetobacter puyangensis]SNX43942.1 NitT/TauT family transport system substrate-binding protein [Acinetobacter puyangensis]